MIFVGMGICEVQALPKANQSRYLGNKGGHIIQMLTLLWLRVMGKFSGNRKILLNTNSSNTTNRLSKALSSKVSNFSTPWNIKYWLSLFSNSDTTLRSGFTIHLHFLALITGKR
jgi:hypothetical protein